MTRCPLFLITANKQASTNDKYINERHNNGTLNMGLTM